MNHALLTVEQLLDRLRPLLARQDVKLLILFGSAASGHTHRDSDIDLGIVATGPFDLIAMTNEVAGYLRTDLVDIVDLRRASPLLAMEALRQGRLLYESRPDGYASFYSLAHRRYVDTFKLRQAEQQAIGNFLTARGLA